MYYLDTFKVQTKIPPLNRHSHRRTLNRDEAMGKSLHKQKNLCFYCGIKIDMSGHLDHVIPLYWGGTNKSLNLVASCSDCNLIKSDQQIEITNPQTIRDYLDLIAAYNAHKAKLQKARLSKDLQVLSRLKRYQPKKVRLYGLLRADLFKTT